jgi:hypothetical protein
MDHDRSFPIKVGQRFDVLFINLFFSDVVYWIEEQQGHYMGYLAWCFDIIDQEIPERWAANYFQEQKIFVLGPDFLTDKVDSIEKLIDGDPYLNKLMREYINFLESK